MIFWRSTLAASALLAALGAQSAVQAAEPNGIAVSERTTDVQLAEPRRLTRTDAAGSDGGLSQERYELGSGDRLKIIFFQNADLSGEFRVQADGNVSVPLLGSFEAAGKTTAEISSEIAAAFQRGDKQAAQVVVEVAEWRPLYVNGYVSKPGNYVFTPGMTVLHAISMAGGIYRVLDGSIGNALGISSMLGQVQGDTERLKLAIAHLAGLLAERTGREAAEAPARLIDLCGKAEADALVAVENRSLKWRRDTLKSRLDSRAHQIALSKDEITAFKGQLQQIKEQKRLKGLQLDDTQTLADKGLSRRTDLINLQSSIADLERSERETLGSIARAERTLSQLDQESSELPVLRKLDAEKEINEVQQQIASYKSVISTSRDLIGRVAGTEQPVDAPDQVNYVIMRKGRQDETFLSAKETTRLHAGDVVVVSVKQQRPATSMLPADQSFKGAADVNTTGVLGKR